MDSIENVENQQAHAHSPSFFVTQETRREIKQIREDPRQDLLVGSTNGDVVKSEHG